MRTAEQIISDQSLINAFGNANFGKDYSKREIINNNLLKLSCSYNIGSTARHILRDLRLINQKSDGLTLLGKEYLFAAFSQGKSL